MSAVKESFFQSERIGFVDRARSLALETISTGEQDPKADVCVCNFLTTVQGLHTPEAEVFLSLLKVGKVDVLVPRVADVEEFNGVTAAVDVKDPEGGVHTEVLVNPIVWSDAKLLDGDSNPAKDVVVGSCVREIDTAVRSVLSRGI